MRAFSSLLLEPTLDLHRDLSKPVLASPDLPPAPSKTPESKSARSKHAALPVFRANSFVGATPTVLVNPSDMDLSSIPQEDPDLPLKDGPPIKSKANHLYSPATDA